MRCATSFPTAARSCTKAESAPCPVQLVGWAERMAAAILSAREAVGSIQAVEHVLVAAVQIGKRPQILFFGQLLSPPIQRGPLIVVPALRIKIVSHPPFYSSTFCPCILTGVVWIFHEISGLTGTGRIRPSLRSSKRPNPPSSPSRDRPSRKSRCSASVFFSVSSPRSTVS